MENARKLVLYIAMSVDGYIATPTGDITFLSSVEKPGEDYGYKKFNETVDTIIMGRKTYDKVLSFGIPFPHVDKKVYIITHQSQPDNNNITFYNGSLLTLLKQLKQAPGKNIYCDGGAELVTELLKLDLIDEMVLSVIPSMLGEGIRLFKDGRPPMDLKLLSSKSFEKGLVQLHYIRK